MTKSSRNVVALGCVALLALAGCSRSEEAATDKGSVTVSPTPTPTPTPTWPITGVQSKKASATKPVLVVKVENDPSIRPQSGLEDADMVVEELVEGGITRFAVVYQSKFPKELGPVRSVRHVDASIAAPVADFFVFSGGARPTISYIRGNVGKGIYIMTEGAAGMHRTNYHYAPHNLYLWPLKLIAAGRKTTTPTSGFFVRPKEDQKPSTSPSPTPTDGTTSAPSKVVKKVISGVNLRLSQVGQPSWTWSTKLNRWVRSENGVPAMAKSGARLSATNVVIIRTKTADAGYRDPAGNFVPRTILTGTGKGFLLTGKRQQAITWSKPEIRSQMTLKDLDGNVISLPAGNIWMELVPLDGGNVKFQYPKKN